MKTIEPSVSSKNKKRVISVTVRRGLVDEARAHRLNTSRAAETGIEAAVRRANEQAWLADSTAAVQAHQKRVASEGMLISPPWLED